MSLRSCQLKLTPLLVILVTLVGCEFDLGPDPDFSSDGRFDLVDNGDMPDSDMTSDGAKDNKNPPALTKRVDFDGGTIEVEFEPFEWRVVPDPANRVGAAPKHPSTTAALAIEYGSEGAHERFDDPRPQFDQPVQRWVVVEHIQSRFGEPLTLVVEAAGIVGARATIHIEPDAEGLRFDVEPDPDGPPVQRIEWIWADGDQGPLYGGGMSYTTMNRRGTSQPLFRDDQFFRESGSDDIALTAPMVINPHGYIMFFETEAPGMLDLAEQAESTLRARFDTDRLTIRMWLQESPQELYRRYTAVTGLPGIPPRWALAPQFVRTSPSTSEEIRELGLYARLLDVPMGSIWLGPGWQTSFNSFEFNPVQLDDPAQLVADLEAQGIRLNVPAVPYLDLSADDDVGPGFGDASALYAEADALGLLLEDADGDVMRFGWAESRDGAMLDFSKPGAADWWRGRLQNVADTGISGLLMDRGQDLRVSIEGRPLAVFEAGDERTYGLRFDDDYHRACDGAFAEGSEPFLLGRSGTWGSQAHVHGILTGRFQRSFDLADFDSIGGLSGAVHALATAGPVGFPFVGSVAGGDMGPLPGRELYLRWLAVSVFAPMMLVSVEPGQEPWSWGGETLDIIRQFMKLRMRLVPYLEKQLELAAATGLPMARPIGLVDSPDITSWDVNDQFMLGDDLMIAPVMEEGARSRTVVIPAYPWRRWTTGELFVGPEVRDLEAPVDSILLFARDTAVIPMQLEFADTLDPSSDMDTTSASEIERTPAMRAIGFATGESAWHDGSLATLSFDSLNQTSLLVWQPSPTAVALYVEFLGVFPEEIKCEGEVAQEDGTLALVPLEGMVSTGYRPLPTGYLLRVGKAGTCTLSWD